MRHRILGMAAAVVLSAALGGCGTDPSDLQGRSTTHPSTSPVVTGPPDPDAAPHGGRTIATGLEVPWDFAALPDGSVLVTLRDRAQLVRVLPGGQVEVAADVPGVVPGGEGGLLGLTLSPRFRDDGLIYLYFTTATDNRVVRFHYDSGGLTDATTIVSGIPKAGNHNGGRLRFGPDGNLYVGTGDAGMRERSQDRGSLAGKILRVGPDGTIPPDNPFGTAVYSYGHRNVQGLGWNAAGTMYASEFGQDAWDELNVIEAGGNYGWPQTEGMTKAPGVHLPVLVWRPADASPSGIAVTPDGQVYVAGLRGERVWHAAPGPDGRLGDPRVTLDGLGRIRHVAVIDDELWVLTNNTAHGTPRDGDDRLVALPR